MLYPVLRVIFQIISDPVILTLMTYAVHSCTVS